MTVIKTVITISWRGLSKIIAVGEKIVENVIFSMLSLPRRGLQTTRKIVGCVFNVYVLFWSLKTLQKRVLDPLLDLTIGMSTLNGWKNERSTRYLTDESSAANNVKGGKQLSGIKDGAKHIQSTLDQLKVSLQW